MDENLISDIRYLVGDHTILFDELYSQLKNGFPHLTPDELKEVLVKQGWLLPQVNDAPLEIKIKTGAAELPPNQNSFDNIIESMMKGPVKMPKDQNPKRK